MVRHPENSGAPEVWEEPEPRASPVVPEQVDAAHFSLLSESQACSAEGFPDATVAGAWSCRGFDFNGAALWGAPASMPGRRPAGSPWGLLIRTRRGGGKKRQRSRAGEGCARPPREPPLMARLSARRPSPRPVGSPVDPTLLETDLQPVLPLVRIPPLIRTRAPVPRAANKGQGLLPAPCLSGSCLKDLSSWLRQRCRGFPSGLPPAW